MSRMMACLSVLKVLSKFLGKNFSAPAQQQLEWTTAGQVHWNEPDARRAATFVLSINNMFTVHGRGMMMMMIYVIDGTTQRSE